MENPKEEPKQHYEDVHEDNVEKWRNKQETPKKHIKYINDNIEEFDSKVKSFKQETTEWRLTNGEAYIMEGSKEVAKVIYPINSEEDFKKFNNITKLLLNAPKMEYLLKDILNHIDSNLISLESSSYLKDDILKLIGDEK